MIDGYNFELELLDAVDITLDPGAQAESLKSHLPALQSNLDEASAWVAASLNPLPPGSPMDDTWDDNIWFQRAMGESGYVAKKQTLDAAKLRLDELKQSENKGRKISGWVLSLAHCYLKSVGLDNRDTREKSGPASLGGQPVAEIIWQARNQDQHYNESHDLHPAAVGCFKLLVPCDLGLFKLQMLPVGDANWQAFLHQQSWAQEVLKLMGWTSSHAVKSGLHAITR